MVAIATGFRFSMFFFFVGGIEPSILRVIKPNIGKCIIPGCNTSVDLVETSDTLKLFFVPVWNFGLKERIYCKNCRYLALPDDFYSRQKMFDDRSISMSMNNYNLCKAC